VFAALIDAGEVQHVFHQGGKTPKL
jgi:hypothetical protein